MTNNIKFRAKKINSKLISEIPNYRQLWNVHVNTLPLTGTAGTSMYFNEISKILIYRDDKGSVKGILQFFTVDIEEEKKGNLNILVDPDCSQKGIGLNLLKFAMESFEIDLDQQQLTPTGKKLVDSFRRLNSTLL